ncbi:hypothetical protein BLOT_015376 [Blomia tropicalis]|nr:hypothetical protein BLOT_015376 [Blomia tropicalis]
MLSIYFLFAFVNLLTLRYHGRLPLDIINGICIDYLMNSDSKFEYNTKKMWKPIFICLMFSFFCFFDNVYEVKSNSLAHNDIKTKTISDSNSVISEDSDPPESTTINQNDAEPATKIPDPSETTTEASTVTLAPTVTTTDGSNTTPTESPDSTTQDHKPSFRPTFKTTPTTVATTTVETTTTVTDSPTTDKPTTVPAIKTTTVFPANETTTTSGSFKMDQTKWLLTVCIVMAAAIMK